MQKKLPHELCVKLIEVDDVAMTLDDPSYETAGFSSRTPQDSDYETKEELQAYTLTRRLQERITEVTSLKASCQPDRKLVLFASSVTDPPGFSYETKKIAEYNMCVSRQISEND